MDLKINNVESEKARNKKFAEENNISPEEMEKIYDEIYEKLPESLTGDKRILRALRKTRGTLRQKANATGEEIDGFILMRFRDNDFDPNAWKKVDEFIANNSLEDAIAKKMVNDEGQYLHTSFTTSFSNQHGKVIDKKNARGYAIAIISTEKGTELRWLSIGKFNVWDKIPLCREVTLIVKEGNQAGPLFTDKNVLFLNGTKLSSENAYYSEDDFQGYADLIEDLCGDIAYYTQSEIDAFAQENSSNKWNYIAVPVISVIRIGAPLDDGTVPIEFEVDDGQITGWASKNVFKGLTIEEGIQGILMLNTYLNKEGQPGYRVGGFIPLDDGSGD